MARVKITQDGAVGRVEIDGQEVPDVVAVGFDASAGEQAEVTLVLAPSQIEFIGDVDKITQRELKPVMPDYPDDDPFPIR